MCANSLPETDDWQPEQAAWPLVTATACVIIRPI